MTCPCSSCVAFATRWRAPWRIVWTAFLSILSHIGLLRPSPAGPGTPMLLPETIVTHTSPAMPGNPLLPEAMTTSHEKCWEDRHFCFAYAPKCSKDCAQCGIPFPCGTMQASMRGTGQVRQLCGICFWESRVDPIMEWCPCYNNARLRDEHYHLRLRALPAKQFGHHMAWSRHA